MYPTSPNPAIHAYKVYCLSQTKLDRECRRQTPDLHRIILHASIVDNIRRWSCDLATLCEPMAVDSDSDTDHDPFDDSASSEDDETEDTVAIIDIEANDDSSVVQCRATSKVTCQVQHIENMTSNTQSSSSAPQCRGPAPSTQNKMKTQTQKQKQNRPIIVRETVVEVDNHD